MSATLKPLSNAINAVHAATTVLPDPTSPWSSRRIGCAPPMSDADFAEHVRLRVGQLEAEPRQKWLHQTVVAAARQRARFGLEIPPAKLHFALQLDEFIQRQPPPRDFHIGQFFGKMNHADRVGARRQV